MALVYKVILSMVHKSTVLTVHKITLFAMRIELTKAMISFLINIKLIQSCETFKNFTAYLTAW